MLDDKINPDVVQRPRFTLRALFIATAFVGGGLVMLRYPYDWVAAFANVIWGLFFAYATVAAFTYTGDRRLFWMAFAAAGLVMTMLGYAIYPLGDTYTWLKDLLIPNDGSLGRTLLQKQDMQFARLLAAFQTVVVSTIAAYIIPWLVQRDGNRAS